MSGPQNPQRRRFLDSAILSLGAAEFIASGSATAQSATLGHNLPQEAPQAFAQAVIDVDGYATHGTQDS